MTENLFKLLVMSDKLRELWHKTMFGKFPEYQTNPRFIELLKMIDEIHSGQLQDHRGFNWQGMGSDELSGDPAFRPLMEAIGDFYYAFEAKRNLIHGKH